MLASLRGFTCCVPNAREGGMVLGLNTNAPGDIRQNQAAMTAAYEMGKNA